jgi:hypothetical protein
MIYLICKKKLNDNKQRNTNIKMFIQISYDSKLTGSKELRMDNICIFERLKTEKLTKIGEYAFAYDSAGKSKEPIFDGFLAGIALLDNDTFNENFMYVPTIYLDEKQHDKHHSSLATVYTDDQVLKREQLPLSYSDTTHIFLLGPMNQTCLNYINSLTGNVIFHVQGEATSPVRKTTTYPDAMTEHPGIFHCSFNLWTGEEISRVIRSKMTHSYTVKCVPNISQSDVSVLSNVGPMVQVDTIIPTILLKIREYMVQVCLLGNTYDIPFKNISIQAIFQDLIDKDNLVSCQMLLEHSTIIPLLSLIGRRVYNNADSIPFSDYAFNAFMDGLNGDVQFPSIKSSASPNIRFEVEATRKNHASAVKGFMELLPYEFNYNSISDLDIVDGMGETSESGRAPFFEPMVTSVSFMKEAKRDAF